MKTRALRIHGKNDLRLETFDLPEIAADEILADIWTDSVCMSSHKLAIQGNDHKRVVGDLAVRPTIIGHEFCGTILKVGGKYRGKFTEGQKYSIQPAMNYPGRELEAPGYSFPHIGGSATTIIIPREIMEMECLLPYDGRAFYQASLSEPVSCIVGAFKTSYHWKPGTYEHLMGIVPGGSLALLAGAGPMGLGAVDYALHGPSRPGILVVTDIDQARLDRAAAVFTPAHAKTCGVDLRYVNTAAGKAVEALRSQTGGRGFDDVYVFAPVAALIEQAGGIAGVNCCINFFAGPSKADFSAGVNFYDVHYSGHHIVGSSGGNTDDMRESLALMAKGSLNPSVMITHIGGLDCAADTVMRLPKIPGGKKLIYTKINMPLTAIDDFEKLGANNPLLRELARISGKNGNLWSPEAEEYLLKHAEIVDPR